MSLSGTMRGSIERSDSDMYLRRGECVRSNMLRARVGLRRHTVYSWLVSTFWFTLTAVFKEALVSSGIL
jgi:hypothetical protein